MKRLLSIALIWLGVSAALIAADNDYIALPTIDGKTIHVKGTDNGLDIPEYKGKIVFLEFWGTHCPPCMASIPHYVNLINKHKDKLAMLGIEVQDTPKDRLKSFAKKMHINYDVVAYRDTGYFVDYIAKRAGWKGSIPFLLILDQTGTVKIMQVGMLPEDVLEKVINDMSKTKPVTPQKAAKK
jgi:thiol-disulfide isomerase/thioredoxin